MLVGRKATSDEAAEQEILCIANMNLTKLLQGFKQYLHYAHMAFKYVEIMEISTVFLFAFRRRENNENDDNDFDILLNFEIPYFI